MVRFGVITLSRRELMTPPLRGLSNPSQRSLDVVCLGLYKHIGKELPLMGKALCS